VSRQTIRIDETAVSGFNLVQATINSATEGMAVPELAVDPDPEFILGALVLGVSKADKERRCEEYAQKPRESSG
jgi:hypothetical protein